MTVYVCTECNKAHQTASAAALCHWGVGDVVVTETPAVDVAVDVVTGAWGDAASLVVVRGVTQEQIDDLTEMADSDIIQWGCDNGTPILPS